MVVAPHGAGLSNTVFCSPGTRVVELMPSSGFRPMFWTISSHVGLDYTCVDAAGQAPASGARRPRFNAPMTVDLAALEASLSRPAVTHAGGSGRAR